MILFSIIDIFLKFSYILYDFNLKFMEGTCGIFINPN